MNMKWFKRKCVPTYFSLLGVGMAMLYLFTDINYVSDADPKDEGQKHVNATSSPAARKKNISEDENLEVRPNTASPTKPAKKNKNTLASRLNEVDLDKYKDKLTAHASPEKIILLALVDTSFKDMTLNFYETSIQRFNIRNYLFIASDDEACTFLEARHINCYVYMHDDNAKKQTKYATFEFNQKMNIRTFLILDALKFGFTVLHTDVDVVFLRNPLSDLYSTARADISCLWDKIVCNAGFLYIKPSKFSIDVYTEMKKLALHTKLDDQMALNRALNAVIGKKTKFIAKKQRLSTEKYLCGLDYFERGSRFFANSATCQLCVVVHNNWIVSKEAKRYRFREVLLWSYDDSGYYSNTTKKYLTYSNPILPSLLKNRNSSVELDALKTALYLGDILDRVVILPRFHLVTAGKQIGERPLNNWIKMSSFDEQFYGRYRENAFLHHPKVPRTIKEDRTAPFFMQTKHTMSLLGNGPSDATILSPADEEKVTTKEILNWFGSRTSAVLTFHSLYGVFGSDVIPRNSETEGFCRKLLLAFKRSDYRQLK